MTTVGGLDAPLQLAVFTGDSVTVYPLPPGGQLRLGRADDNEVRLNDASVSRAHAVVHVGPPLEIEDLGGANATMLSPASARLGVGDTVAMRRIAGTRHALAVGDVLSFGAAVAVVRHADPEPTFDESGDGAGGGDVVVRDPALRAVYDQASRAAQGILSVLVLGETGVGKDVLARFIHRQSPRAKKPFLALNCAALSETLLESELFGYEKGAFTGAVAARAGLLESADGGTVFLDEIGDLPMPVQVKLLRVLEAREVMRVGARTPKHIDVRFVSATHRDLEAAAAAGTFRQDLYFRLNGISLSVPPLRERPTEIPDLAQRFLVAACRQLDRRALLVLSPAVLAAFQSYAWPGNVRELRNVVDRAVALADATIGIEHLPLKIAAAQRPSSPAPSATGRNAAVAEPPAQTASPTAQTRMPVTTPRDAQHDVDRLKREMAAAERQRIVDALAACSGNQTRAAEMLGISRRTLVNRLDELELSRPRKR